MKLVLKRIAVVLFILIRCSKTGCNCFYIGQTLRSFSTRFNEHKKGQSASAISTHAVSSNHPVFHLDKFLDVARFPKDLLLRESMYIKFNRTNPNMLNDYSIETCSFIAPQYSVLSDKFTIP